MFLFLYCVYFIKEHKGTACETAGSYSPTWPLSSRAALFRRRWPQIWSPPAPRVYHVHGPHASWLSALPRHKGHMLQGADQIVGKFIFSQCRQDLTPRYRLKLERKIQKVGPPFHLHPRGDSWQCILGSGCFGVQFLFAISELIGGGDSHILRGCRGAHGRKLSLQNGLNGGYRNQRVAV